jgi:LexA-binding, inner membrane-associated putative hydrolase
MFAINHAATALIFKRRFPDVSLLALLLSVQAMEFAWVVLNYLGIERTTTGLVVRYVGDIHLAYMPFSHSVLTVLAAALLVWGMGSLVGRARLGSIVAVAILSHLVLDLLTHNGDIALGPFHDAPKYGTFLYGRWAPLAFVVELAYGLVCWWIFRGGRALLAIVVGFNVVNISEFFRAIPGPEDALAGHPLILVTVILVQILVTMWAIWWGAGRRPGHVTSGRNAREPMPNPIGGLRERLGYFVGTRG